MYDLFKCIVELNFIWSLEFVLKYCKILSCWFMVIVGFKSIVKLNSLIGKSFFG